jgi:hypothetical protein
MNTLKMKVLLILINTALWQRIRQSLLIWISTSLLGSFFHWTTGISGMHFGQVVILSLVFSTPALICLFPILYFLQSISTLGKRIVFAIASVLLSCIIVIAIFLGITRHYPFEEFQLTYLLLSYVISAELSFFLVAQKLIFSKKSSFIRNNY